MHLRRISVGLARRGLRVHVLTHKPAEMDGVTVERFRIPPIGLWNLRRWSQRRLCYLRDLPRRFDIVHLHFLCDWGLDAEWMDETCLAVTPWGSDITPPPGEGTPSEELTALRRTLLRRALLVTAWGPRFAQTIADFSGLPRDRIQIVPLGVDTRMFRRASLPPWEPNVEPTVGFFKGFRPVYGASIFVQAMPRIAEAIPDVRFCMIGDGEERNLCRDLAQTLNVDHRISWRPRQPHEALPAQLAVWRVSVVPSRQESFGLSALESSAMEVPVVASNVGGLPDAIRNGYSGLLVPPGNAAALADAVVTLLRNSSLRSRMGRHGREMVQREFEWADILDQWVRLYAALRERKCVMV